MGAEPFWLLVIGDDRIVLRLSDQDGDAVWPRTLPRTENGARIWQSGEGVQVIAVEARPAPARPKASRSMPIVSGSASRAASSMAAAAGC